MRSNNKILGIISIILAIALLLCVYIIFNNSQKDTTVTETPNIAQDLSQDKDNTEKNITITVRGKNNSLKEYELSTHAKYLSQAMDEAEGLTYSGSDGAYGIMIQEVNGERAVYEQDGAYWAILVDGEYGMYGVDAQPIEDGVEYSLVYTIA